MKNLKESEQEIDNISLESEFEDERMETYKDITLIYNLMMGTLVPNYVKRLQDKVGEIVKNELQPGTEFYSLEEENEKLAERICKYMQKERFENEDVDYFIEAFDTFLFYETIAAYEKVLLELEEPTQSEDYDDWKSACKAFVESKHNLISKLVEPEYIEIVNSICVNMGKELEIFKKKVSGYGKYFKNYENSKEEI